MGFNTKEKAKILEVIPSTEPCSFGEFCSEYPDTPAKGERSEWAGLFGRLSELERDGLLRIERDGRNIEGMQLTEAGAQWVRDFRKVAFSND